MNCRTFLKNQMALDALLPRRMNPLATTNTGIDFHGEGPRDVWGLFVPRNALTTHVIEGEHRIIDYLAAEPRIPVDETHSITMGNRWMIGWDQEARA